MKRLETKYIRTGLFGIIIIFFFLPFLVISCPGYGSQEVNGVQVAFGYIVSGERLSSVTDNQLLQPKIPAIIALVAALAGILFSFFKKQHAFVLCMIAAIVGFSGMFLLRLNIDAEAASRASQGLVVQYAIGYWLALGGFLVIVALLIILHFAEGGKAPKLRFKLPFKLPGRKKRSSPRKSGRSGRSRRR
jgi:hypothetical protein